VLDKNYVDGVAAMIAPLPKKCASIVMISKASRHLEKPSRLSRRFANIATKKAN
jgi:hypothetical protein